MKRYFSVTQQESIIMPLYQFLVLNKHESLFVIMYQLCTIVMLVSKPLPKEGLLV